ncbi:hypothetical protein [Anaerocaecibacter muris]|uniref:hypothetical protein n=1 Tax=Anaerocaecibacter muris TaxID=2941513 RepID=UPI003F68BE3B
MIDDKTCIDEYDRAVSEINCAHADAHGKCELLSDSETNEYCPLSPCPHYKEID